MPITDIAFQDGIFFCREVGQIDRKDAEFWADKVREYAAASQHPIVALVDATAATYITAAAREVFARASAIPGLHAGVVAATDFRVAQNSRLTAMLAVERHTLIFSSLEKAREHAEKLAQLFRTGDDEAET